MLGCKRKVVSGHESPATTISDLPDDLMLEILTRLPGNQVGLCKCVCSPWRTMIRGRPFRDKYRKRGVLLYWMDVIKEGRQRSFHFHYFYCALRRLEDSQEEFIPLRGQDIKTRNGNWFRETQMVNGLFCVEKIGRGSSSTNQWTLHNVCTGETMKIPNPNRRSFRYEARYTYHLGYDPKSRVYKLLRLINRVSDWLLQGAHVINLGPPSGPPSSWRELDCSSAGISDLQSVHSDGLTEVRTCPDDGVLCWLYSSESKSNSGRLCFDLNKERFWFVKAPPEPPRSYESSSSVTLWRSFLMNNNIGISCYDIEDGQVKNWSRQFLELLEDAESRRCILLASGEDGSILVMDREQPHHVYSYCRRPTPHDAYIKDVFSLGKFPEGAPDLHSCRVLNQWQGVLRGDGRVCCLLDSNNFHLSLDEILGGDSNAM